MNKLLSHIFWGAILASQVGFVNGQPIFGSKEGYSVICVEEQSTGFNWRNKNWVKANFNGKTLVVSRIPFEKYKTNEIAVANNLWMCSDKSKENFSYEKTQFVNECYSISEIGEKPSVMDSHMCSEYWDNNKMKSVSCSNHSSKVSFEPAGGFIRHPWHMDARLDQSSKDSLAIGVGKCSPIQ